MHIKFPSRPSLFFLRNEEYAPRRKMFRGSKENSKSANSKSKSSKMTFGEVLALPAAHELFKEHLKREFAVENLLFYEAIEDFKDLTIDSEDEQKINDEALRIYMEFCTESAPLWVNLKSNTYKKIKEALGETISNLSDLDGGVATLEEALYLQPKFDGLIDVTLYDNARDEIFTLMQQDSFRRFEIDQLDRIHNV